jgi:hypothetical protein
MIALREQNCRIADTAAFLGFVRIFVHKIVGPCGLGPRFESDSAHGGFLPGIAAALTDFIPSVLICFAASVGRM